MNHDPESLPPAIVRGRIEELTIYEVTEGELDTLERGSPDSLYLNFAIFLLSVAATFVVALLAASIKSDRAFAVIVIVTTVFGVAGLILLGLWWRSRLSVRSVVRRIRDRVPPQGERIEEDNSDST